MDRHCFQYKERDCCPKNYFSTRYRGRLAKTCDRDQEERVAIAADAQPTEEEVRNVGRNRRNKSVPNTDWMSPTAPYPRNAHMKDCVNHLAYKLENAVELDSHLLLAGQFSHEDHQRQKSILEASFHSAQRNPIQA
jgi:hypothetical protein